METSEVELALATALAVGLLIGLEREQSKADHAGSALGGIRTYPLIALVGALATVLGTSWPWLPPVALLGVLGIVAISYAADLRRDGHHGMTTEMSMMATYLLGVLAASSRAIPIVSERLLLVAAGGVAITFLLSSKEWFHTIASRLPRSDFYATVKFLIVVVIALPLLPNRDLGPLAAINPRTLGLMVVTISALSFIGYVGMRWLGPRRGLLIGAALGGLVSSTATTLSLSRRAHDAPGLVPTISGAIAISWMVMLSRVAVVVALTMPTLLGSLAIPLAAMGGAALLGLVLTFRRGSEDRSALVLENPFELASAIKVTLVFALVLLVSKAATTYVGAHGLYLAAGLAGTTDVDAIALSTAKLARTGLDASVASIALTIAVLTNTLVKTGLAVVVGGAPLGRRVGVIAALVITAGLLASLLA